MLNIKKLKNIILRFTSYIKIKFEPKDFDYLRFFNLERDKVLTEIDNEYFIEDRLFTNKVYFRLNKECNHIETLDADGNGTITDEIFNVIKNDVGQIVEIDLMYEDGTDDCIIVDLFYDSPEPENNFHCESEILENGNLYVALDENINKDLSDFKCK